MDIPNGLYLSRILRFQQAFLEYGLGLCHQGELLHSTLDPSWLNAVGIDENVPWVMTRYRMC